MDIAEELKSYASALAQKYTGKPWGPDFEFKLYLQLSGLRYGGLFELTKEEENELRRLSQAIESWIIYSNGQLRIIKYFDWLITYCEWHYGFIWNLQSKAMD